MFLTYTISMILTENGLNKITELINKTFDYINTIRNTKISRDLYDDLKRINQVKFQYKEKTNDIGRSLAKIAENLFSVDYEDSLYADYNYNDYNSTLIKGIFEQFVPENCIIFLGGDKEIENKSIFKNYFKNVEMKLEKIYKTKYWIINFSENEIKSLKQIETKRYKLRKINNFITNLNNYTFCLNEVNLYNLGRYPCL